MKNNFIFLKNLKSTITEEDIKKVLEKKHKILTIRLKTPSNKKYST